LKNKLLHSTDPQQVYNLRLLFEIL